MKRENRYIVIKRADAKKHLNATEKDKLAALLASISDGRAIENKGDIECVVVEHDWPMFERTWAMIESWVRGYPQSRPPTPKNHRPHG